MRKEQFAHARVADGEGANGGNRIGGHAILDPNIAHVAGPFILIEAADPSQTRSASWPMTVL
jgi:hypothetical protein